MRPDQQRVRDVVVETIRLLCRTGLHFQKNLQVQGLLGITVDDDQVFLIHVNDSVIRTVEQPSFPFGYLADAGRSAAMCHADPNGNCGCEMPQMGMERRHDIQCTMGVPQESTPPAPQMQQESMEQSCPTSGALMYEQVDQKSVAVSTESYGSLHCAPNESAHMVDQAAAAAGVPNYGMCVGQGQPELPDNRPTIVAIPSYPGNLPHIENGGNVPGARMDNGLPPEMVPTSIAYVMAPPPGSIIEFVPPPAIKSVSNVSVGPSGGVVEMLHEEQVVTEEVVSTAQAEEAEVNATPQSHPSVATESATSMDVKVEEAVVAAASAAESAAASAAASASQVPMTFNSDDSCSETDDDEKYSDTSGSASEGTSGGPGGSSTKPELILQSQLSTPALMTSSVATEGWPVAQLQRSLSDSCGDTNAWRLPASVLAGVMPTGGPHSSAYYQQQILAAAAAAAHNRAARAAAGSGGMRSGAGEPTMQLQHQQQPPNQQSPFRHKMKQHISPSSAGSQNAATAGSHRRLPRRPRESEDKRFRCPFCELAYYHKKHLKYHLAKKHGL